MTKFPVIAVLAAALVLTGCGQPIARTEVSDVSGRTVRAVTTTGMIADIVENVGGARVDVTALMGPGVDPHLFKASERDVLTLAESDVVFYNGLHLEAKLSDVLERIHGRVRTVAVTDGIPRARLIESPQFEGSRDPHVWFDVTLWIEAAEHVRDALVELDPAHARLYRDNAAAYLANLASLHEDVTKLTRSVPAEQRVLITAHDAFSYFGSAYGFDVRGLQGISTAAEAGTADIQALADFIAERRIRAIFVESSVPQQTIHAVQEAVRSRGFDVEIGGQLFSDAMGEPGTPEGTYVGMVRHNVETIVSALRGEGGSAA